MTAKECRTRISLNRSLVRLGIAAAETPQMPLVFIENELAIAPGDSVRCPAASAPECVGCRVPMEAPCVGNDGYDQRRCETRESGLGERDTTNV